MTVDQFFTKYQGKHWDFDGLYGNQCVDLVNFYQRDVIQGAWIGTPITGGARDWYENYPNSKAAQDSYIRIKNDVNDPNQLPQKGDVIIWNRNVGGGYGHIAIVKSANSSGFISLDQNWPTGSVAHFVQHNWNNILGWLRPRKTQPTGGSMKTTLTTARQLAYGVLGRDNALSGGSDADLKKHHVNVDLTTGYINTLHNSTEAKNYRARRARLQASLTEITKQRNIARNQLDAEQVKTTELTRVVGIKDGVIKTQSNEIESLKAKLAAVSEDTELLNGFGNWLVKLITRLGLK